MFCKHKQIAGECGQCRIEFLEDIIKEAREEAGDVIGRSGQHIGDILKKAGARKYGIIYS